MRSSQMRQEVGTSCSGSVFGPLLPLNDGFALACCLRAAKARPGMLRRAGSAVGALHRLPCAARSRGPSRNSLRELRSLRSNSRDESVDKACPLWRPDTRPRALCCSAPHKRAAACPDAPLLPGLGCSTQARHQGAGEDGVGVAAGVNENWLNGGGHPNAVFACAASRTQRGGQRTASKGRKHAFIRRPSHRSAAEPRT